VKGLIQTISLKKKLIKEETRCTFDCRVMYVLQVTFFSYMSACIVFGHAFLAWHTPIYTWTKMLITLITQRKIEIIFSEFNKVSHLVASFSCTLGHLLCTKSIHKEKVIWEDQYKEPEGVVLIRSRRFAVHHFRQLELSGQSFLD